MLHPSLIARPPSAKPLLHQAASDVYCPVSGVVTEVNELLSDTPGMVNTDAEDGAWFIKVEMSDEGELDDLMDTDAYGKHCDESS